MGTFRINKIEYAVLLRPEPRYCDPNGTVYLILFLALLNFTHMAIPLAFGTLGSALGVIAVFFSNAALMFGGGFANARGARAGG
jgi:hypothetical protein